MKNATRRFAGLVAVDDVSFSLAPNEILGLIGPNGAGKTTLVSLVSGTLAPTSGEIVFEGRRIEDLP
ncbi:MAG TPA: ATP-binding cassette domain-containing protein, partial [Caldimonas sp.]|nr:ATP-binding cassette domain-containing protein [Caldimonas sp.]